MTESMSDDADKLAASYLEHRKPIKLFDASGDAYVLARAYQEARREIERLTGKMCLICGAKEPCELDKSDMSPCTFDPHPIEAAQAFLKRATAAEETLAAMREQAERDAKVIEAARYFDFGGDWGTRMAMITNGAATREEGIAHNKEIVRAQKRLNHALAGVPIEIQPDKIDPRTASVIWAAWIELNAIRARDGVPYTHTGWKAGVSEEWFSAVVDGLADALGKDAQPWPSKEMKPHIDVLAARAKEPGHGS